jgi:hypothetical protein
MFSHIKYLTTSYQYVIVEAAQLIRSGLVFPAQTTRAAAVLQQELYINNYVNQ